MVTENTDTDKKRREFILMDRPQVGNLGDTDFQPARSGFLSNLGRTLTGISRGLRGEDPNIVDPLRQEELAFQQFMLQNNRKLLQQEMNDATTLATLRNQGYDFGGKVNNAAVDQYVQKIIVNQPGVQDALPITDQSAKQNFEDSISGPRPDKFSMGGVDFKVDENPITKGTREGIAKSTEAGFKESEKLGRLVKLSDTIRKQWDKALPNESKTPLEARIAGTLEALGARTGLRDNPDLIGLENTSESTAIQLIRLVGEVGNLSKGERESAAKLVKMSGLNSEERLSQVKIFVERAIAQAPTEGRKFLLQDEYINGILNGLGVDMSLFQSEGSDSFSPSPKNSEKVMSLFKGVIK